MPRRSIGKQMRARIFLSAGGVCHLCRLPIDAMKQRWEVEHVKPLHLGGADDEANMRPAHVACHAAKTAAEAPARAKADRNRARSLGIKGASSRLPPASPKTPHPATSRHSKSLPPRTLFQLI